MPNIIKPKVGAHPDELLIWINDRVQCQRCGTWVRHVSQSYVDGLYWCDLCSLKFDKGLNRRQVTNLQKRVQADLVLEKRAAQARQNFGHGESPQLGVEGS